MGMLVRRQLVLRSWGEKADPACMCIKAASARIEPLLRPDLPARSTAGLQGQQHRQPLPRAAHAAADRQRREVAAAAQRAVVVASRRSL
jgi:hypothetical protein